MAKKSIKDKAVSAMFWNSIGKFGTMGISFISNMVLARLLMPSDFGTIGMLHIFIAIAEVFILGGFGQALIQKKNPTHSDYTTVFYWNLVASIFVYIILFISAPWIASFYEMPQLKSILRVMGITLIIQSFSVVQSNQLVKQLKFRVLTVRNILAVSISTVVAVIMALKGFGVWSLVCSSIVSSFASVILLWSQSSWRPTWEFSMSSLKELFAFGGLMALSSLIDKIYSEIQGLIIGKWYSAADLGYYNQAHRLEQVPMSALSQIVSTVSFPVFSSLQNDKEKLLRGVRMNLISVSYLNFPLSFLMMIVGAPLIRLVYGPNWDAAIPYFQILCFGGMMFTTNSLNNQVIKALGKSNIYLYAQLVKRSIGVGLIILGAMHGVWGLLVAVAANSYIFYLISAFINSRLLDYGLKKQLKDIGGTFLVSGVLAAVLYWASLQISINHYVLLPIVLIAYVGLFILLSRVFKLKGYEIYMDVIKSKFKRK